LEKSAWEKWLIEYQISVSAGQKFMSFDDYIKKLKKPKTNQQIEKISIDEKQELEKMAESLKNKPYTVIKE
jgi:hypothetical protein